MKARYFTIFSYIGTKFRSSEKLWLKDGSFHPDPESVQGLMEIGLTRLRPLKFPSVFLSSRTDGGVHALNSTAHFDLDRRGTGIYDTSYIVYELNNFFHKTDTPILIKDCMRVADNFNARYQAKSRTYLYRLAVLKKDIVLPENVGIAQYIPIEELKRCQFIRRYDFDIEKFKEGAKYFVGYHDFTTFRKFDKLHMQKQNRRTIYYIDVRPSRPLVTNYLARGEDVFDYWDIEIKGRSFVHNQIRRMVGTLISVAVGKLPAEEIKVMLQVPSKHSWHNFIPVSPPHSLYLCHIEYDPEDLVYKEGSSTPTETCEEDTNSE